MANLGNLIVRGVTRILGDAYANKFIGNLQGNADTATSAIKASIADSATNAASANKASIATAVQDYGTSDYREIKIGYNGSGLSSSTITHAVGFTDGGTKIKDISKDEFRNWLATASGTWNISITGNADTLDNQHLITQVSDWNTDSLSIFKSSEGSISNAPTTDGIYGLTLRFHRQDSTYHTDLVTNVYSDALFFRRKTESGYGSWRELIHSGNISSQSVNYATNAGYATSAGNADTLDNIDSTGFLRQIVVPNNTENDFNTFSNMTLTGRIDPTTGASLKNAPWSGSGPAGGYGVLTYLFDGSNYGTQIAFGYCSNKIYIRNKYWGDVGPVWDTTWDSLALTSEVTNLLSNYLPLSGGTMSNTNVVTNLNADLLDGNHASDFATSGHTHNLGNKPESDLSSTYPQGISVGGIYDNGYPFAYGCTITASGNGGYFQIAGQWNSSVTGDSNYDFPTEMYIRGRRDSYDVWTTWTRVLTDRNYTNVLDNRYYTKTECNNKFQPKGVYLTEQNLQGYATQEWVRGEEYLYRSGGTMDDNAQIKRKGESGMWIYGRDNALIRETSSSGYHPLFSLKTVDGSWELGEYNLPGWYNIPVFSYITDENYNNGNNAVTYQIQYPLASGTIALTSDLTWSKIADKSSYATRWPSWNEVTSKPAATGSATQPIYWDGSTFKVVNSVALANHNHDDRYLKLTGGTMDARAEIGITTKLFIGNSTSPDTCYTKFNCILHGGGDESNPNWVIRDNGYAEFKSSVSANAFYASSDIRLKNILDDINIDFDKLKLIPKKYYTWKGSDILQLGTIAQDIQKIYPEVVSKNENGYLSVDYSKLSIIALAAIDKLNERIKELECQIKL